MGFRVSLRISHTVPLRPRCCEFYSSIGWRIDSPAVSAERSSKWEINIHLGRQSKSRQEYYLLCFCARVKLFHIIQWIGERTRRTGQIHSRLVSNIIRYATSSVADNVLDRLLLGERAIRSIPVLFSTGLKTYSKSTNASLSGRENLLAPLVVLSVPEEVRYCLDCHSARP